MIPKERMLITMRHGTAHRVPVAPDMSNKVHSAHAEVLQSAARVLCQEFGLES